MKLEADFSSEILSSRMECDNIFKMLCGAGGGGGGTLLAKNTVSDKAVLQK